MTLHASSLAYFQQVAEVAKVGRDFASERPLAMDPGLTLDRPSGYRGARGRRDLDHRDGRREAAELRECRAQVYAELKVVSLL